VLAALADEDVTVEQLHPEYAAGQFEVSVSPSHAVGAADRSVLVRNTIRAVSLRHGLEATFSPSVTAGYVGNGGHLHLSLWRDGRNLCAGGDRPYGMTEQAEAFAAGVLSLLPALCAVGAPTPASYLRLVPSHWAGAFACWGYENREAAMRVVTGGPGTETTASNLEVKCFDLAANPYLVIGSVIAAGLHGIENGLALPPEISGDPGLLSDTELQARGIGRLPQSLEVAVEHFVDCSVLRKAMGDMLFDAVVAVRRAEAERFAGASPEEIVDALRHVY
jgi:glutamine synthetase